MRLRYAAPVAVVLLALTGCTSVQTDGGLRADPDVRHSVLVHTDIRPGPHGELFIEGALPEIRLVDAAGQVHRPVRDHRDVASFPALSPGVYRLRAALRPCDGNCGVLDPPTERCAAQVRVDGREVMKVRWMIGRGCGVARA